MVGYSNPIQPLQELTNAAQPLNGISRSNSGRSPSIKRKKSSNASTKSRRECRYSDAEQKLATSLSHLASEPSPQELQIRTLEQATALLSSYANVAKERAADLKARLEDREVKMDSQEYGAMQRERWMEERRRERVEEEAKTLKDSLLTLERSPGGGGEASSTPPPPPQNLEAERRRTNLTRFLQQSYTKAPTPPHHHDRSVTVLINYHPRRMSDASPFQLSTTKRIAIPPVKRHLKTFSLDGHHSLSKPTTTTTSSPHATKPFRLAKPSLSVVAEVSSPAPSPRKMQFPDVEAYTFPPTKPTPLQLSPPLLPPPSPSPSPSPQLDGGEARIYTSSQPRSKDEILASSTLEEFTLPEYATALISGFDTSPLVPLIPSPTSPSPSTPSTKRSLRRSRLLNNSSKDSSWSWSLKSPDKGKRRSNLASLFSIPDATPKPVTAPRLELPRQETSNFSTLFTVPEVAAATPPPPPAKETTNPLLERKTPLKTSRFSIRVGMARSDFSSDAVREGCVEKEKGVAGVNKVKKRWSALRVLA